MYLDEKFDLRGVDDKRQRRVLTPVRVVLTHGKVRGTEALTPCGERGGAPWGEETRPQYAGALPLSPRRGGFLKKSPCTPKTLIMAKNCVFCREIPRNPCRKLRFRLYRFFAPFFQRKEQGSKGRRPLGRTHLKHAGALPLTPRRGGFLKKSPCTPKTFEIAKNCVFCREILRNPCRKRSFRLYRFFAPFFQRKKRGSKGQRPLGETRP